MTNTKIQQKEMEKRVNDYFICNEKDCKFSSTHQFKHEIQGKLPAAIVKFALSIAQEARQEGAKEWAKQCGKEQSCSMCLERASLQEQTPEEKEIAHSGGEKLKCNNPVCNKVFDPGNSGTCLYCQKGTLEPIS